jgi:hypothetical protein
VTWVLWCCFGDKLFEKKSTAWIVRTIFSIVSNLVEVVILLPVSPVTSQDFARSHDERGIIFLENLSRINLIFYLFWILLTVITIIVCFVVGFYTKCCSCCDASDERKVLGFFIGESCILIYEALTLILSVLLGFQEEGNTQIVDGSTHGSIYRTVIFFLSIIFSSVDIIFIVYDAIHFDKTKGIFCGTLY